MKKVFSSVSDFVCVFWNTLSKVKQFDEETQFGYTFISTDISQAPLGMKHIKEVQWTENFRSWRLNQNYKY